MLERIKESLVKNREFWQDEYEKVRSRREFGKIVKISFLSAWVSSYLSTDIQNFEEGNPVVKTGDGNFHMLYEFHDEGIKPSDMPTKRDVDLFFREGVLGGGGNVLDTEGGLTALSLMGGDLIDACAKRKIRLAFGDIRVPKLLEPEDLELVEAVAGMGLLCLSQATEQELKEKEGHLNWLERFDRRQFMLGIGVLGWIMMPKLYSGGISFATEFTDLPDEVKSLRRLYGFMSNFHPENTPIFFRNVVWANKLLTLTSEISSQKNNSAEIVCNVGAGHSGLQDFLKIDRVFCRKIITSFPASFIENTANINGGIQALSSTVIVDFPLEGSQKWEEASSIVIKDEVLEEMLKSKIGEN